MTFLDLNFYFPAKTPDDLFSHLIIGTSERRRPTLPAEMQRQTMPSEADDTSISEILGNEKMGRLPPQTLKRTSPAVPLRL